MQMATRNINKKVPLLECTQFVLHKSQYDNGFLKENIIDFSERKLIKLINNTSDAQLKLTLTAMLHDFVGGKIALAWRKGTPVYMSISRET